MVVRAKVRAMSACAETLLGFITFPDLDQSQQNKKLHIRCRAGKGRDAERRKTQIYRHSTERKTQRYRHSTERRKPGWPVVLVNDHRGWLPWVRYWLIIPVPQCEEW